MKTNPFPTKSNGNFIHTALRPGEQHVKNSLAVTPSEMLMHAQQGIPIAAQSSHQFYDGDDSRSFDMPLDQRRGVDPADLWMIRRSTTAKLKAAHNKDVHYYG